MIYKIPHQFLHLNTSFFPVVDHNKKAFLSQQILPDLNLAILSSNNPNAFVSPFLLVNLFIFSFVTTFWIFSAISVIFLSFLP